MRKTIMFMMVLMVILGGCSQEASKNDKSEIEYSKQEDSNEEPDEVINEIVVEEIKSPEYYLSFYQELYGNSKSKFEVTYDDETKTFVLTPMDHKFNWRVDGIINGVPGSLEEWNGVVDEFRRNTIRLDEEYRLGLWHTAHQRYLTIAQGGEVVDDFMNE